eukprot:GHRQ01022046.1.p3 GENE.GHRQ01022046.1~~GHRQ01022046.1.p3  ORF type:complete len:119 (+),score=9.56 GHRQ01022046.1:1457-1813(+)
MWSLDNGAATSRRHGRLGRSVGAEVLKRGEVSGDSGLTATAVTQRVNKYAEDVQQSYSRHRVTQQCNVDGVARTCACMLFLTASCSRCLEVCKRTQLLSRYPAPSILSRAAELSSSVL